MGSTCCERDESLDYIIEFQFTRKDHTCQLRYEEQFLQKLRQKAEGNIQWVGKVPQTSF